MSKIVSISEDVYPISDVIDDIEKIQADIKDLVMVVLLKDGTAYVSHTGLNFMHMALACKLMDKEFSTLVDLQEEEDIK